MAFSRLSKSYLRRQSEAYAELPLIWSHVSDIPYLCLRLAERNATSQFLGHSAADNVLYALVIFL